MSELAQGSSQVRHRYVLAVRLSAPALALVAVSIVAALPAVIRAIHIDPVKVLGSA